MNSQEREERLQEIIAGYLEAEESGNSPERGEFLARHSEWQAELELFLSNREKLAHAFGKLGGLETPSPPKSEQVISTLSSASARHAAGNPALPDLAAFGELEKVDQGGIGVVYRGKDPQLPRDLAIKVLRPDRQDQPELVRRFIEEAKITGKLQHPGVVPVYSLGQMPDGRPYFTMKLIRGHTLAALLVERASPSQDLPRFLKVFEQVCQTLAYAHSQEIIHRDLKPANIMVGAFAEVQVMDWGFAKVLRTPQNEQPGTADNDSLNADLLEKTKAGQVMGTLPYMSPEQARGEVDRLDERCDVFSLGAILCAILTGKPAYQGTQEEVLAIAQCGDLADAWHRLEECGADPELIALVRQCLDPNPDERPQNARVVAEAVAAYQAGVEERLRAAELARAAAQAKAGEERKRRRLTVALAAIVVLVILGSSGAALWYFDDQVRQEREALLRQTEIDHKQTLAEQGVRQAVARAKNIRAELHEILKKRGGVHELINKPVDWQAYIKTAKSQIERARSLAANADESLDPELMRLLDELDQDLRSDDADRLFAIRVEKIRLDKATIVDGKMDETRAAAAYEDACRDFGLDVLKGEQRLIAKQIKDSPINEQLLIVFDDWAWIERKAKLRPKVEARLEAVVRLADPDSDHFPNTQGLKDRWTLEKLALQPEVHRRSRVLVHRLAIALEGLGGDGVALLKRAQSLHPEDFWLNFNLATILSREPRSQSEEAIGYFRAALAIRPKSGAVYNNLGNALAEKKDLRGAIAAYRNAIDLDGKYAMPYLNLGLALGKNGDLRGAIAAFRNAIDCDQRLPGVHYNLGIALRKNNDVDGAIAAYEKAIVVDPNDARAFNNLGNALADKGHVDKAIAALKKAITVDRKHAMAHNNLGTLFFKKNDLENAIEMYRTAIKLNRKLALPWRNLGDALRAWGDLEGAFAAFKQAVALEPKNASAHYELGILYRDNGKPDEAIRQLKTAIQIDGSFTNAYFAIANTLLKKRDFQEAINYYGQTLTLAPDYAEAHCNLGHALKNLGSFAQALKSFKQGHELGSRKQNWHYRSAEWIQECERLLSLDQKLPAVLKEEIQPATPQDWLDYIQVCQLKKAYASQAKLWQRAFMAYSPPRNPSAGYRFRAACAAAMAADGQGQDAGNLTADQKADLRKQVFQWLQTDVKEWTKRVEKGRPTFILASFKELSHLQTTTDLDGLREEKNLVSFSQAERQEWKKLWAEVERLRKQAQDLFRETRLKGVLTAREALKVHEMKLSAGYAYVIDLESNAFNTFLRLEDATGKKLAENDGVIPGVNRNSRLLFTPEENGVYRLVATALQKRGVGPYTLTIREFTSVK